MIYESYKLKLLEAKITAGKSSRYHQKMEWRYAIADRSVKLLVGILAVFGLVFSVPGVDYPRTGFAIAIVSLVAAVALNIILVGERQSFHAHMLKAWWNVRKVAILEERK